MLKKILIQKPKFRFICNSPSVYVCVWGLEKATKRMKLNISVLTAQCLPLFISASYVSYFENVGILIN